MVVLVTIRLNLRTPNDHFSDGRTCQYLETHFTAFPRDLRRCKAELVVSLLRKVVVRAKAASVVNIVASNGVFFVPPVS
jgi:hypothetical protein